MKEVVIIKTKNGEPIDKPDYLSQDYVYILEYLKKIEIELKRDQDGDTDFLLERLLELKSDLKCLKQVLNGEYNIIVVRDFRSDDSITEMENFLYT